MQFCKHGTRYGECDRCDVNYSPKEWQGLTDDEIEAMWKFYDGKWYDFATAIEQALKEKNT